MSDPTGPHAALAADGLLRCVHGVPSGPGSTTMCRWAVDVAGDPVELWRSHGETVHGVRCELRWDVVEQSVVGAESVVAPNRLADVILAADRARVATREKLQAEHAARRARVVDALRGAVAPDADATPVARLAGALGVEANDLRDVLRDAVARQAGGA